MGTSSKQKDETRLLAPLRYSARGGFQKYVYFALRKSEAGLVKIGCSTSVHGRMLTIGTQIRDKMDLIAVMDGGFDVERSIHDLFAVDRVYGEWFNYSQVIKDWLASSADVRFMEAHRPAERLA